VKKIFLSMLLMFAFAGNVWADSDSNQTVLTFEEEGIVFKVILDDDLRCDFAYLKASKEDGKKFLNFLLQPKKAIHSEDWGVPIYVEIHFKFAEEEFRAKTLSFAKFFAPMGAVLYVSMDPDTGGVLIRLKKVKEK